MRRFIHLSVLFSFVAISVCAHAEPETKKQEIVVKVAGVLSLTGPAAQHGSSMRDGMLLAQQDLKARGIDVELSFEDDQTNPVKTVTAVKALLARGYRFFVGPTWSFLTKSMEPILRSQDGLAINPAGSSEVNGGASPAVLNMYPSRYKQTPPIREWLRHFKDAPVAILYPEGDWGEVHSSVFMAAASQEGNKVVLNERFSYGLSAGDCRSWMAKIRQSGAKALLTTSSGDDVAQLIRARDELHLSLPILSTDSTLDAFYSGLLDWKNPPKALTIIEIPSQASFAERFQARFARGPGTYSQVAYQGLVLLAEAAQKTDGTVAAVKKLITEGDTALFDSNGDSLKGQYQLTDVLPR